MKTYRDEDGNLHWVNGAAVEYLDGDYFWYYNGEVHRYYGPAMKWLDGHSYWIFDERMI